MMRSRKRSQIAALLLSALGLLVAGSSLYLPPGAVARDRGKELFERRCGGCHALDRDKEGPRLGGVYGRTAGSVDSFEYSDALKKSGIVWTDAMLDRWLTDTAQLVPGTDMAFRVDRAEERRAIIDYLKQASPKR